jgi:hypothetical protein
MFVEGKFGVLENIPAWVSFTALFGSASEAPGENTWQKIRD